MLTESSGVRVQGSSELLGGHWLPGDSKENKDERGEHVGLGLARLPARLACLSVDLDVGFSKKNV